VLRTQSRLTAIGAHAVDPKGPPGQGSKGQGRAQNLPTALAVGAVE
jgi:hypothetical protein